MSTIQKLAIVINAQKFGAVELAEKMVAIAKSCDVSVVSTTDYPIPVGFLKGQDACCVLGGDGTLLGVVREAIASSVPVFGVNRGKLGFLATFGANEILACLKNVLNGEHTIIQRSVIKCQTGNGETGLALNDAVLKSSCVGRLASLKVFCNEQWVTEYFCDGLIFSTPTGSTAYNLSAGGPIVTPGAGIMTMTPICPHTLTNRSVIFAHDTKLRVESFSNATPPHLSLDGQSYPEQESIFPIELEIAQEKLLLLQPRDYSYFKILRNKLKWGDEMSQDSNS